MGKPSSTFVMIVGGVLAVAAGMWFTVTGADDGPADPGPAYTPAQRWPRRAGRMPPRVPPMFEESNAELIRGLSDDDPGIRAQSAMKLKIGALSQEALPALARGLEDGDSEVRIAAAAALGEYADLPSEIVVRLVLLVRDDPLPRVRVRALWAVSGRGNRDLPEAAIALYRGEGNLFTGEVEPMNVLDGIAQASPGGSPFLTELAGHPDPKVQRAVQGALDRNRSR